MPRPEQLLFSQPGLEQFKMFDVLDASGASLPQPETAPTPERRLSGKVALITGTRGIAKATAEAFAREGARMIFVTHTGTKQKRVGELVASIQGIGSGSEIIPVVCDITNPEARQQLAWEIKARVGKLDILYHNAAGGFGSDDPKAARRINAEAKVELTRFMAPLLVASTDPRVLNIESVLSEYWGTDIAGIPAYDPVAQSKYEGKIALPQTIRQLNEKFGTNIRYATVCATGVDGTITWTLLKGRYKDQIQRMLAASEGGKATDTQTVAQALLKLAVADVPFGHTEYAGIPHWDEQEVRSRLDLYDDTSRKIGKVVFAQPDLSFGHYILKKHDLSPASTVADGKLRLTPADQRAKNPLLPDAVFTTDDKDVEGHFAGDGTPKIVPLWKIVAGAFESAERVYRQLTGKNYYVESVRALVAKRMVLAGDSVEVYLKPSFVGEAGNTIVDLAVDLRVGGSIVDTIGSLMIHQGFDPNDHLKPMVLEAAALTNGLHALHQNPRERVIPLFRGVKRIDYAEPEDVGVVFAEGTELVTQSSLSLNAAEGFIGQSITRIGSKRFATTEGLECGFEDRDRAIAMNYPAAELRGIK